MIEINNPFNGIRIKLSPATIRPAKIDAIRPLVDERITSLLDAHHSDAATWFKAYVDLVGPTAAGAAWFHDLDKTDQSHMAS